jgi:hypothetical protein
MEGVAITIGQESDGYVSLFRRRQSVRLRSLRHEVVCKCIGGAMLA